MAITLTMKEHKYVVKKLFHAAKDLSKFYDEMEHLFSGASCNRIDVDFSDVLAALRIFTLAEFSETDEWYDDITNMHFEDFWTKYYEGRF